MVKEGTGLDRESRVCGVGSNPGSGSNLCHPTPLPSAPQLVFKARESRVCGVLITVPEVTFSTTTPYPLPLNWCLRLGSREFAGFESRFRKYPLRPPSPPNTHIPYFPRHSSLLLSIRVVGSVSSLLSCLLYTTQWSGALCMNRDN